MRLKRLGGKFLREESGFTLSELLVVMMIMLIVLFALYSIFDASLRVYSFGNSKIEATEGARVGLEKMAREVRAAYPYDKVTNPDAPRDYVLFSGCSAVACTSGHPNPSVAGGAPATDPAHVRRKIMFGNDLPSGTPAAPNWKVDYWEVISYELSGPGPSGSCPVTGTEGVCTLQRITYARENPSTGGAVSFAPPYNRQPAVENVMPGGLTFTFLRADRTPATSAKDARIVRISLRVKVNDGEQTLTTNVELRGRSAEA